MSKFPFPSAGASQCVTEDGIVEPGEECDGGMDCTMCGLDVIVELSLSDPNTNNYSLDYFDLDQVVFLANTTDTFIRVSRIRVRHPLKFNKS